MGEKQPGLAPKVLASATARTKRPHKQHTGSDPKCSCDANLTPVSLQDRSKNGEPNPFSRPDKPFDYNPDQNVISSSAWKDNAALTFFKLLNNLQQDATLYPLLDRKTSAKHIADWTCVETFKSR